MTSIHFKKPNKKSVMPYWADEVFDKEEVATTLYQAILDQRGQCGNLLELYFGSDESIILDLLTKNQFQPDFIYEHLNSEFGKGVILGLLMFFLKEEVEAQDEEQAEKEFFDEEG